MRSLVLDIETAPNKGYHWGLYDQNISLAQLIQPSYTLCWAARWRGEKKIEFRDIRDADMIPRIYELVDSADAVIHFNGNQFDMPILHREFALTGLGPPAPYRNIDLLRVVRKKFRFASNKLEHVAEQLGVAHKGGNSGFGLWKRCMEVGDDKSWAEMKKYNRRDVLVTDQVYDRVLPWIDSHPNQQLYSDGDCPRCGATGSLTRQGHAYTQLGRFQRFKCGDCNGWSRSGKREAGVTIQAEL